MIPFIEYIPNASSSPRLEQSIPFHQVIRRISDMDGLLAEISNKRKALADVQGEGSGGKKYLKKGEIERALEESEKKKNQEAEAKRAALKAEKAKRDVSSMSLSLSKLCSLSCLEMKKLI